MDPATAIGAVASVITLAQTALALSTTVYSVCGALASASEDLQTLAEDLKVFSQSLTILSRLLEDNKSWYCDEIYLLTAKIIKDCVSLYEKIDAILVKLQGGGKTRWTKKMMFVVKAPQIRKLLERLRHLLRATAESSIMCTVCLIVSLYLRGKALYLYTNGAIPCLSMHIHAYAPNELLCFHSLMQRSFRLIHAGFRH